MALISVTPPPGVVTNGTDYQNAGRWVDSNLIRFADGILKPMGGWDLLKSAALDGAVIGLYAYNDNQGRPVLAVGTRNKVYTLYNFVWTDITPSSSYTPPSGSDPLGFGAYNYGVEDYGDARSQSGLNFNADSYSFDNWGQELVWVSSSDGKIYKWNPNPGGTADTTSSLISNAPTAVNAIVVSNERHLVAIGSNADPRRISFSDREDYTSWTSTSLNSAGFLQIPSGGRALSGIIYKDDILIHTDTGLGAMRFIGSPLVYSIRDAGTNCKAISSRAIVSAGNFVAWLGERSVFVYDGAVKEIPCPVQDYLFSNLNENYKKVIAGGVNSQFNEIVWFFPSGESQQNDRYIKWNTLENVWDVGILSRGAYIDQGVFDYPIAGDPDGFVYYHEKGNLFNSKNLGTAKPTATSGPIELSQGNRYIHATQVIPDSEANTLPGVTLSFKGRFTPLGSETNFGSVTFDSDGYEDVRFSTRSMTMEVTGDSNQDFAVGKIRLDVTQGGSRR